MAEDKKDKKKEEEKPLRCHICGKPSEASICHACEDRIRGEAVEKRKDTGKAGRTDSGRR